MNTIDNDAFDIVVSRLSRLQSPHSITDRIVLNSLHRAMNKKTLDLTDLEYAVISMYEYALKNVGT